MLVLTRQVGEEVVIGSCVRLKITAVQGQKVKLGIEAPKSVRVDRLEVHEKRPEIQCEADRQTASEFVDVLNRLLRSRGYAPIRDAQCELADGSLVLHGKVPSYYIKQLSQHLAKTCSEGCEVANRLEVQSPLQIAGSV